MRERTRRLCYMIVGVGSGFLGAAWLGVGVAAPDAAPTSVVVCVSKRSGAMRVPSDGATCRRRERVLALALPTGTVESFTKAESDARYLPAGGTAADSQLLDGLDSSQLLPASRFASVIGGPSSTITYSGGWGGECVLGEMIPFAGNFAPTGTLFAHGQLVPIAQNTALFSLLGFTYGGDGQTTFALPDLYGLGPGNTNWLICVEGIYPARS